uniref:Uncharacterized protein n=1 Tax=Rhizophora mucronata TaxID=61149 RepID=A0A2P2NNC1_RHIMU
MQNFAIFLCLNRKCKCINLTKTCAPNILNYTKKIELKGSPSTERPQGHQNIAANLHAHWTH